MGSGPLFAWQSNVQIERATNLSASAFVKNDAPPVGSDAKIVSNTSQYPQASSSHLTH